MDNAQKLAVLPMWVIDRIKEEMRLSPAVWQTITAAVEQAEVPQTLPCEVKLPPGTVIGKGVPVSTLMLAIAQREGYPVHAQTFAEQHQGEPVALPACKAKLSDSHDWDQGYRGGWRACLDEIAQLGPLYTRPAQGEPVAVVTIGHDDLAAIDLLVDSIEAGTKLYTHADPGEVERLCLERRRMDQALVACADERDTLRAQLAECEAMASMVAEREWAEHVGTGPVSSKVETAFTQLHNELHEAQAQLAERNALLARAAKLARGMVVHPWAEEFARLAADIERIGVSASAEPSAPPQTINGHRLNCKAVDDYKPGECSCGLEPSAPVGDGMAVDTQSVAKATGASVVERNERAAFERAYHRLPLMRDKLTDMYFNSEVRRLFDGWMARASLEGSRPTVLTKCVLCDQLQADLTERDERIDQLRSGYVFETGPYQVELSEDQWSAALGVFENYNMGDDKHFVFLEEQGRGVISEILIEIGVARAPDANEVAE